MNEQLYDDFDDDFDDDFEDTVVPEFIDLESEMHTCTARIHAMEHPEEHNQQNKGSRLRKQEILTSRKRYENEKLESEIGDRLHAARGVVEGRTEKGYKPYNLFDGDGNKSSIKHLRAE